MLTSVRSLLAATVLAGSVMVATPALAQDEEGAESPISVSGNVAITNDYRFRGVSQSGGDFALQGGFDLTSTSGFYVGAWGSSISLGPAYGELELDLYGGWTGALTEGLTADVGVIYYTYPAGDDVGGADPDTDVLEAFASLATTIGPLGATAGVNYAWDQDSLGGNDNLYLYTDFSLGVPSTPLTFTAHAGYTDGALAPPLLAGAADDTGLDWSLGVSMPIYGGVSGSLTYVGVEGPSIDGFTDDTIVATLSFAG